MSTPTPRTPPKTPPTPETTGLSSSGTRLNSLVESLPSHKDVAPAVTDSPLAAPKEVTKTATTLQPPSRTDVVTDSEAQTSSPSQVREYAFEESRLAPWRFWTLSIGISLGLFLAMLDSSIVATSLLTIGRDLGAFSLINWVALAYTLAYLGCAGVFARLADIVGRRNAFLSAFVIFFGFSLGCGFAQTMHQLIALRALQGVGGSGLYSLTMTIWPEVAPFHLQQYIASMAGLVVGIAGVLGPVLGGILTHYTSWRWIFWINGPVGFVAMVIFLVTWPSPKHLPHVELRPWSAMDFLGSFLLIAAAVLFTFSFQNAGTDTDQWGRAVFIAPLVAGVLCWAALFAWEYYLAHQPWGTNILAAFPLKLFQNRVYFFGILNTMFIGFPFFVSIYSVPLRLQLVNGKSALIAGVMLLPMLGGVAVGSWAGGAINIRFNRLSESLAAGSALVVVGCALETTLSESATLEPKTLGFLVFIGFGAGMVASTVTILAAATAPKGEHAPAQGILAQIRILGGSVGIAASSAIQAREEEKILGSATSSSIEAVSSSSETPAEAAIIRKIMADSFKLDMKVSAIMAGAAVVIALCAYQRDHSPLLPMHKHGGDVDSHDRDTDATTEKGFSSVGGDSGRETDGEHHKAAISGK